MASIIELLPAPLLHRVALCLPDPSALAASCSTAAEALGQDTLLVEWARTWWRARDGRQHKDTGYSFLRWRRLRCMSNLRLVALLQQWLAPTTHQDQAAGANTGTQQMDAGDAAAAPLDPTVLLQPPHWQALSGCLADSDCGIAWLGVHLLATLTGSSEGRCAITQHVGASQALVSCLHHSSAIVIETAMGEISHFDLSDKYALLQQAGLLSSLARFLEQGSDDHQQKVTTELFADWSRSPGGCHVLLQQPGLPVLLVHCLGHRNYDTRLRASCAVRNLSQASSSGVLLPLALAALSSTVQHGMLGAANGLLCAIAYLAWSQADISAAVQQPGALAAVACCLACPDSDIVAIALEVVVRLAAARNGFTAIVQQASGCLPALVLCMGHEEEHVAQAATKLVEDTRDWVSRTGQPQARAAVWQAIGRGLSMQPSAAQLEVEASLVNLEDVVAGMAGKQ